MNKNFIFYTQKTFRYSAKYLFVFLLILFFLSAQAQTALLESIRIDSTAPHTYQLHGFGIGVSTMRDALLSPVRYQGFCIGVPHAKWQFRSTGWLHQKVTQTLVGTDTSSAKSGNMITSLYFSYQHYYLKSIWGKIAASQLYVGPYWETMGNLRTSLGNTNNVLSYDAGLGVGASVLLKNRFRLGKSDFEILNQISSVFLGAYIRPQYNWSLPVIDQDNEKVYVNIVAGSWKIHPNLDYRLSFDFLNNEYRHRLHYKKRTLIQKTAYRFSYIWQYRGFNTRSPYQRGQSMLMFGPIIKL